MKRRGSTPRGEGPQPPQHHHHYLRFLQHGGEAAPQPAYAANGWNGHCQPRKRPGIHPRSWHWTAFAEARLPVFLERKARDFRAAAEEAERPQVSSANWQHLSELAPRFRGAGTSRSDKEARLCGRDVSTSAVIFRPTWSFAANGGQEQAPLPG